LVLAETTPREFARAHGISYLDEDDIALNPAIAFKIETFAATDEFKPKKPFQTRVKWRDRNGNEQSKLLLTNPKTVIEKVLRGEVEPPTAHKTDARRPSAIRAPRRNSRKTEPAHS
jgi:hypothetical protein